MTDTRPILIAGPTASGKSTLAIAVAERVGGWVINADSMQVYDGWRLLTARPTAEDEARVTHRLYGHVDPATLHSAGIWLREVATLLLEARTAGAVPVIVGGSGLNFTALTRGLADIPLVSPAIRDATNAILAAEGAEAMRARLLERDPTAATLDILNPRRIVRAWEVLEQTGRSLADWAASTPPPLVPPSTARLLAVEADRDALVSRIEGRFDGMVAAGLLDEVRAVAARGLDPDLPAMKAVGAPPFLAHIRGETPLEAAIERAKADTRRYAKRQRTWLRNQMPDWPRVPMGVSAKDALALADQAGSGDA